MLDPALHHLKTGNCVTTNGDEGLFDIYRGTQCDWTQFISKTERKSSRNETKKKSDFEWKMETENISEFLKTRAIYPFTV